MNVVQMLNGPKLYLVSGGIIFCVAMMCIVFLVRAYKAGIALGMDKQVLHKTMISSATFTVLPSVSILLGVITLSGTLGVPLPWLRLSVIGALHYETSVADAAARAIGMNGLSASEMTLQAFTTIALLMGVGISSGTLLSIFFTRGYISKLQSSIHKNQEKKKKTNFGDKVMAAMFIGLISAYIGAYLANYTAFNNPMPILTLLLSCGFMACFVYFIEQKKQKYLENFAVAGSMLLAMATVVAIGVLF